MTAIIVAITVTFIAALCTRDVELRLHKRRQERSVSYIENGQGDKKKS